MKHIFISTLALLMLVSLASAQGRGTRTPAEAAPAQPKAPSIRGLEKKMEAESRKKQLEADVEKLRGQIEASKKSIQQESQNAGAWEAIAEKVEKFNEQENKIRTSSLDRDTKDSLLDKLEEKRRAAGVRAVDDSRSKAEAARLRISGAERETAAAEKQLVEYEKMRDQVPRYVFMCKDGHQHATMDQCDHPDGGQWVIGN